MTRSRKWTNGQGWVVVDDEPVAEPVVEDIEEEDDDEDGDE